LKADIYISELSPFSLLVEAAVRMREVEEEMIKE